MFYFAIAIFSLITIKVVDVYWECRRHGDLNAEKKEILQRRNYLESKLMTSPDSIIQYMPEAIGPQFQGEWALYSCSMFSAALVNISLLYPETRDENLALIDKLIQTVNTPEMRRYDTVRWGEDAMETLDGDLSHLSYISHLAWMICGYKRVGGDGKYDELCSALCEAMDRRIQQSPSFNLETYPYESIYIPDMLVAIVALKQYADLNDGKYASTVQTWLQMAREKWCDRETGLLASTLDAEGNLYAGSPVKGSYAALNCSYLSMVDEAFAKEQYELFKKQFWKDGMIAGFKEYRERSPLCEFDIDAGPILFGLSPSGTAFAMGAVTYFEDQKVRKSILATAEKAGQTLTWGDKKHYALANLAIVGEAIMLAMRTNVRR